MFHDIHSARVDIDSTKPEPRRPPKSDLSMPDIVLFYTQNKASQRLANIVRNFYNSITNWKDDNALEATNRNLS